MLDYWQLFQDYFDTPSNHPTQQYGQLEFFRKHVEDQRKKDDEAASLLMALATLGGPMQHLKTYLTRADLPGDPRAESAWAMMGVCGYPLVDLAKWVPRGPTENLENFRPDLGFPD